MGPWDTTDYAQEEIHGAGPPVFISQMSWEPYKEAADAMLSLIPQYPAWDLAHSMPGILD